MPTESMVPTSQFIRVLVVDDDEEDLLLLHSAFRQLTPTLRVHCVSSGDEAIRFMKTCVQQPILVISDMHMPMMDGAELVGHLRQLHQTDLLSAVILSSLTSEVDRQRCLLARANAYIAKPQQYHELLNLVRILIHTWLPFAASPYPAQTTENQRIVNHRSLVI